MPISAGPKEAIKILQRMSDADQERILKEIGKKDSNMEKYLRENLYSIEDLIYIDPKMLTILLRKIDFDDFSLALKVGSEDLKNHLYKILPQRLSKECQEIVEIQKVKMSKAKEKQSLLVTVMMDLIKTGDIVLSSDKEEYV